MPAGGNSAITGLRALQNRLIVFKDNSIHTVDTLGIDTFESHLRVNVGVQDQRTIQPYEDRLIFANKTGVWMFDGLQAVNISEEKVGSYYLQQMKQYKKEWTMCSAIFEDYYILCAYDVSGDIIVLKDCRAHSPFFFVLLHLL